MMAGGKKKVRLIAPFRVLENEMPIKQRIAIKKHRPIENWTDACSLSHFETIPGSTKAFPAGSSATEPRYFRLCI
jgi:hypothetical protein